MAALTLEAVYRALKRGEPASVYYLTGEVDILKDELTTAITRAAVDDASRDFNLDVRSAGDLDGEALHSLVETPPMLALRRAVVVKNLEQWRANASVWQVLLKYLEHPSPTTVLVLTQGAGEKTNPQVAGRATHVEVGALSPAQVERWVNERARRAGIGLEPDAAKHLIGAVGNDLAALGMELEKIAAAVAAEETVTLDQVSQFAGVRHGETLIDWVDAVLRRDPVRAVALLDVVLPQPGVNGVRMGMALGTALLGVRWALALADAGTAANRIPDQIVQHLRVSRFQNIGNWGDESKRWARAAQIWSGKELDEAIAAVYETDRALKNSTVSDERAVLAGLLLQMGTKPAGAGVAA